MDYVDGMKIVLFHVQHLYGTGHLKRILTLAENLYEEGWGVVIMSGGVNPSHIQTSVVPMVELPAMRSVDETFKDFVDENNQKISEEWKERRLQSILKHFYDIQPDILVVETFPFGRRMLGFELIPLLQAAKSKHIPVFCSVRDIVHVNPTKDRSDEVLDHLHHYFNAVLVHGDRLWIPLEYSFSKATSIKIPVYHTGYVSEPDGNESDIDPKLDSRKNSSKTIVVSGGGGASGKQLFNAAIQAADAIRSDHPDWSWRLMIPLAIQKDFLINLPSFVQVLPPSPQFRSLLSQSMVSVSQCGYNTFTDIVQSSCRSVVVPFEANGQENEQRLRAEMLQKTGYGVMIPERDLYPESLLRAIEKSCLMLPCSIKINMEGSKNTAEILKSWI